MIMELTTRLRAYVEQLEADAPDMGELLPEGEVLSAVAERLREILDES